MQRKAFTFIEIIMVIVILGIVASIGTNIISNMYEGYVRSQTINRLQQQTELTLDQIAKRLQYRIKETTIARIEGTNIILPLDDNDTNNSYNMIEWIGYDNEGFKGDFNGTMVVAGWSGFVDLNRTDSNRTQIITSGSRLDIAENIISNLSDGEVNLTASASSQLPAIIFKCPKPDENLTRYGWDHTNSVDHNYTLRVERNGVDTLEFAEAAILNSMDELCEQYWLAWSAYALVLDGNSNDNFTLNLHYNYQPWYGETYHDARVSTLAENVSTFRVTQIGDSIRVKLCIQDNNTTGEPFGFCKEKAIW